MELMKELWRSKASGKGSVFRLSLPNVSFLRVFRLAIWRNNEPVDFDDFEPATLLVVDDNETNRKSSGDVR